MSTLPELFRPSKSTYILPSKQGGIFDLKLARPSNQIDHAVQPEVQGVTLMKKYSDSRAGTSCTNRTERTRRASSFAMQRPYSRQSSAKDKRIYDIQNYGSSRIAFAIMEHNPTSSYEADSLKQRAEEQLTNIFRHRQELQIIRQSRQQISCQVEQIRTKYQHQLSEIHSSTVEGINKLKKMMSELRRQTGMETKVNKNECLELGEAFEIIGNVLQDIDETSHDLSVKCLK